MFVVHALNKLPYSKLDSKSVGVKEGVVFLTYSSLIASSEKGRSRLQQLAQWCASGFDGLVVFDEVLDFCSLELFSNRTCNFLSCVTDAIKCSKVSNFLLPFIAKGKWLHCSATKPKIWYRKLEVSQHVRVKQFLICRFVLKNLDAGR